MSRSPEWRRRSTRSAWDLPASCRRPEFRRQGIAATLIREGLQLARADGGRSSCWGILSVTEDLDSALTMPGRSRRHMRGRISGSSCMKLIANLTNPQWQPMRLHSRHLGDGCVMGSRRTRGSAAVVLSALHRDLPENPSCTLLKVDTFFRSSNVYCRRANLSSCVAQWLLRPMVWWFRSSEARYLRVLPVQVFQPSLWVPCRNAARRSQSDIPNRARKADVPPTMGAAHRI